MYLRATMSSFREKLKSQLSTLQENCSPSGRGRGTYNYPEGHQANKMTMHL